jgi:hypothetical protein
MTYMNAQGTDWSDLMQEDASTDPQLSKHSNYVYATRNNKTLFDLGKGTKSLCTRKEDDVLAELVSDSIDGRGVPLFLDYDKFSNPFFKFKTGIAVSASEDLQHVTLLNAPSQCDPSPPIFAITTAGNRADEVTGKHGSEFFDKSKTPRDMLPSESRRLSSRIRY